MLCSEIAFVNIYVIKNKELLPLSYVLKLHLWIYKLKNEVASLAMFKYRICKYIYLKKRVASLVLL